MHSRVQQPCDLLEQKSVYIRKELNSHRIGLVQQHGRRLIVFWNTNMAAMTSCAYALYGRLVSSQSFVWDASMFCVASILSYEREQKTVIRQSLFKPAVFIRLITR